MLFSPEKGEENDLSVISQPCAVLLFLWFHVAMFISERRPESPADVFLFCILFYFIFYNSSLSSTFCFCFKYFWSINIISGVF